MKHNELINLLYKHKELINKAYSKEQIDDVPNELIKDAPIFQKVAKKYELSDAYIEFANMMLGRVEANYIFGDYIPEINLLISLKNRYMTSKDSELMFQIKELVKTIYKRIEQRDRAVSQRVSDIINNSEASLNSVILQAEELNERFFELIGAFETYGNIFTVELRKIDDSLDDILIDLEFDLQRLNKNIPDCLIKLSDFILRTNKRKQENIKLASLSSKILKEQDKELEAILLSKTDFYLHTLKERNKDFIKTHPSNYDLEKSSFLENLKKVLNIKKIDKILKSEKPYILEKSIDLKAVNIKLIEEDIFKEKPENIYLYLLNHSEIKKFKDDKKDLIFAFKVYLTLVQNNRENIVLEDNFTNNIKVAKWI